MLYNLAEGKSIKVYGYLPGAWASVVGSLLIITPLMCIPVFLFISLYKVGATICISPTAKTGVATSLKAIFFPPRIPKPWPHLPVICTRLGHTNHSSRCVGAWSSGRACSPTGGRTETRQRWRRPEECDEAAQKHRVTHLMRENVNFFVEWRFKMEKRENSKKHWKFWSFHYK